MRDDRDHCGGPTAASRPPPGLTRGVQEVRVSLSSTGGQSNDVSTDPAISGDGSTVAFFPLASDLGPGDTSTCSINDQVNFTDHPGQCPDICVHSG